MKKLLAKKTLYSDAELIFKKDNYYYILNIFTNKNGEKNYGIAYKYKNVETPSIMFINIENCKKYFYTDKEIRKLKLDIINEI